ncbi:unnamed protein product [Musa textilis]
MEQSRSCRVLPPLTCYAFCCLLSSLCLILLDSQRANAYQNYTVGDALGWYDRLQVPQVNYQKWVSGKNFSLGDFLVFNTDKGHTVVQTYNVTTYKRCNYNDAETDDTIEWSAGAPKFSKEKVTIAVPLLKEGMTYFFSGNNDGRQCRHGQHFKINVTHGQGLPESLKHHAEAPAPAAPEKGGVVPGEAVPSVPSSFSNPVQAGSVEASSAAGESLARMLRKQQRGWRFHLGLSLLGVLLTLRARRNSLCCALFPKPMAILRAHRGKHRPRALVVPLLAVSAAAALAIIWFVFFPPSLTSAFSLAPPAAAYASESEGSSGLERKYLYWGSRIDCPGKHCDSCAGLGHQESSLRCALEEALFLQRVFVMPSRMCINPLHNKKGILHQHSNTSSEERWAANSCPMDSLYDFDIFSSKVQVILDNSKMWYRILSTSMKLEETGVAYVEGVSRVDLKENIDYSNVLLINRTTNPLAWFMECKDRTNRSSVLLPYSFLPMVAARKLRDAADKIKALLGDYDAIHVRRGDKIKTRKDQFGVIRTLHPHLDRDTRPEFIQQRIEKWIPAGRTLFIASNERSPGFFSPLSARYKLAYSSNFSGILDPVIENNYQLFMVERLVLVGAKTFVKTFKVDEMDLSLTDDPKKNAKHWQIPIYTMEREGR